MSSSHHIGDTSTRTRLARSARRRLALVGVVAASALASAFAGTGIIGDGPRATGAAVQHLAGAIIGDGPRARGGGGQHLASGIIGDRPER